MRIRVISIVRQDLPVGRYFFVESAQRAEHQRPIALKAEVTRPKSECSLTLRHGQIEPPLPLVENAQSIDGFQLRRRDGQRRFKTADRVLLPAGIGKRHTHAGKGRVVPWIDLELLFVAGQCARNIPALLTNERQFVERRQGRGPQLQCGLKMLPCHGQIAQPVTNHAEIV